MAKIKYSALVQEMRNKLNGSVASRNRYGNYWRNKTTPVNPQTASQQNNRARLSTVSQAWRDLTPAQRGAFTALAAEHPFTDIFGDQHVYDGKAMFSKLNMNRLVAGVPISKEAVSFTEMPFAPIEVSELSVQDGIEIDIVLNTPIADHKIVVYATPALSPTINFVKNRYRQIGSLDATTNILDVTSYYDDTFGGLSSGDVGKVVHFRAHVLNELTGQVSLATEASAFVEA